jgi:hypothetical protein
MKMVMQIFCIVYIAMCGLLTLDDILPELISKEERWYVGVRGVVALMIIGGCAVALTKRDKVFKWLGGGFWRRR